MAAQSTALSLKEYLKRYQSCSDEPKKSKKKKKERPKPQSIGGGIQVVDDDPVWQKSLQPEDEEEDNSVGDETPLIEEDIEVKRMKRLEALRSLKPYHGISDDGSGWVQIPKTSRPSTDNSRDLSPQQSQHNSGDTNLSPVPHQQRQCFDSPFQSDIDDKKDLSPPRHRQVRLDTPSPEPQFNGYGREASDLSPPRKRRIEDLSPPRKRRIEDLSPPRKRRIEDLSPPRKRHIEDLSPPRKQHIEDLSPPPRSKFQSQGLPVADLSPIRKSRKGPADDLSPPRRYQESTEADHYLLSRTRKGPSEDLSHPRQPRNSLDVDLSPPRRTTNQSPGDFSHPPRTRKSSLEPNLPLPPRAHNGSSKSSRNIDFPPPGPLPLRNKEPSLTKEVRMGGLLSAKEMKEEIDKKKNDEKSRFASMDPLMTGKSAEAVHRDKDGRRISKEELKKPLKEKKEPKPLEWGKGIAQKREAERRGKELELEKDRPFARSRDDPELDKMLKERIRWGDTMAHLVKQKTSEKFLEDYGENEKMKESGFLIPQTIPSHSWLKRGLDVLPNRFGIQPGRHWDGVDRSNGYEKDLYKRQNEKRAAETEAYLWSVADM